jgi:hypothetical protein
MAALGQTDALHQAGVYNRKEGKLDLTQVAHALRGNDVTAVAEEDDSYVPVGEAVGVVVDPTKPGVRWKRVVEPTSQPISKARLRWAGQPHRPSLPSPN